ncbi:MAG TPA: macro domain-containing protein [Nocardia sp.]|uniref:macro domain-containing protein n=1 Tax=Nocardia sp. TaxID=1821 RepID=UPI002B4AD6A6|nr:macro domain-containing protein [Nocardia sp.]HLS78165.1 macro domain-containing protein [Nocardia sp.]
MDAAGTPADLTIVDGDITTVAADVIVTAAPPSLRGDGGGVDGAIHRVAGPAVRRESLTRYPSGLCPGDAGWTSAGDLPATWLVHAVGPRHAGRPGDRLLLETCYRRALRVAGELGARSAAFPLIGAGAFGRPLEEAVEVAVDTLASTPTTLEEILLVAYGAAAAAAARRRCYHRIPLRLLDGVAALHRLGFHRVRVLPGVSPSGTSWRLAVGEAAAIHALTRGYEETAWKSVLHYTSAAGPAFAGAAVTASWPAERVAALILETLPVLPSREPDPAYVAWYAELLTIVRERDALPVAYAEFFLGPGWRVDDRDAHPPPPSPPGSR